MARRPGSRQPQLSEALRTQLDAGESEVIALTTELTDVVAVLDDKKARRVAQKLRGQEHTPHVRLDEGSTTKDLMMSFSARYGRGKRC